MAPAGRPPKAGRTAPRQAKPAAAGRRAAGKGTGKRAVPAPSTRAPAQQPRKKIVWFVCNRGETSGRAARKFNLMARQQNVAHLVTAVGMGVRQVRSARTIDADAIVPMYPDIFRELRGALTEAERSRLKASIDQYDTIQVEPLQAVMNSLLERTAVHSANAGGQRKIHIIFVSRRGQTASDAAAVFRRRLARHGVLHNVEIGHAGIGKFAKVRPAQRTFGATFIVPAFDTTEAELRRLIPKKSHGVIAETVARPGEIDLIRIDALVKEVVGKIEARKR